MALRPMSGIRLVMVLFVFCSAASAAAQSVSGVRGLNGGVAPLFGLVGPGTLYIDNQGTQGFIYTPGNNFESYSFRNPTTGQAWSGAMMTLGPQLSVGLIQGANQVGAPVVFPPVPRGGAVAFHPIRLARRHYSLISLVHHLCRSIAEGLAPVFLNGKSLSAGGIQPSRGWRLLWRFGVSTQGRHIRFEVQSLIINRIHSSLFNALATRYLRFAYKKLILCEYH